MPSWTQTWPRRDGINAVKGVESGEGFAAPARTRGRESLEAMSASGIDRRDWDWHADPPARRLKPDQQQSVSAAA
jgi:hypothetical protein